MKSYAIPFAIAGALLTAALLVATNLITTPDVLWCIPPAILLALWPAGVVLCSKKRYTAFSIAGSLLVIGCLAALNWITLPESLWFFYAAPLILCWPLGMLLGGRMRQLPFALLMAAFIAAYCLALNFWLVPRGFWAIHPIFVALWWPMSLYFLNRHAFKAFSVAGSLLTIAYLIGCNLLSTSYPWALYACFPIILWPLSMFFGKQLGAFRFSVVASLATLAWYGALNIFLAPVSPWIIFIAFPLLWWPLSVRFYGRRRPDIYAVVMSGLSIVFFAAVNLIYSPGAIWAFIPAFALLWWPLSVIFYDRRRPDIYAVLMTLLSIAFFAAINILYSPGVIWAFIPAFALLWWPLSVIFHGWRRPDLYAVVMTLLSIAFFAAINILYSPGVIWAFYPAFALLWWPLSAIFARRKAWRAYSVVASLLIIAFLAAVNLLTSPGFLWFIFPGLCILWWPLAMAFKGRHKSFGFAIASAALLIGTLLAVNLMTSPGFLWFIFPSLCILWWPAAAFFAKHKSRLGFSIAGSLLVAALAVSLNLTTSPGFLWCAFPIFGILWWPLGVLFHGSRKHQLSES